MQLKQFTKLAFLLALLMGAWQGQVVAQTYFGAGNPQAIPISGSGTSTCSTATTSVATVPIAGTIGTDATLESVTVELTHTFDNDLEISLISPMGTSLDLSSDNGGAGDDYFTTVFMDGAPSILTGSPPFDGTFSPEGGTFAGTFAGESIMGDWTLFVCDDLGGDTGTLFTFEITFGDGSGGGDCTGYAGDSEGDPLPDIGTSGSFVSEIAVPDAGVIGSTASIGSVELDLDHTFDGDLQIDLVSPAGTRLTLSDNNGGAGDNYENTIFMDGFPTIGGSAPFTGTFEPDGGTFAAAFGGESIMGTWRLEIEDDFAGDGGTFGSVTLNICADDDPCPVPGFEANAIGCGAGDADYCYDAGTDTWTVTSDMCYNPAFYRSSDSQGFASTDLCGDGEIIAEVTGVTGSGFGGISMREDLSASSKMLQLMIDGSSLTRRELRQSTGGTAFAHLFQTGGRNWLRLTRSGNIFSAFHSNDGVSWQTVITTQIAMANCIEVGLMTQNSASSGDVEATFNNVNIIDAVPLVVPEVEYDIAQELPTNVEVYPNPASTEVNVILGDFYGEAVEIQVYNKLGQIVSRKVIDEVTFGVETMDVSQFSNGTYLFKIITDAQEETRRVVVNR